jgi:pyruvate/2-oxoglutarate dehydrogenase complex dihydrolipoamide acyltransferase (E2) component
MTYYFVKVPKLPKEITHQMGTVKIIEYTTKEGGKVKLGQPIAIVENWWARMVLKAIGSGYLNKTFFSHGAQVLIGDPFAIIICDPEDSPKGNESCELEIIENIREKPFK